MRSEPGYSLIGRRIRKPFDGQLYNGEITQFYCKEKWYHIVYEDGDEEDVTYAELKDFLISEDSDEQASTGDGPAASARKRQHSSSGTTSQGRKRARTLEESTPPARARSQRQESGADRHKTDSAALFSTSSHGPCQLDGSQPVVTPLVESPAESPYVPKHEAADSASPGAKWRSTGGPTAQKPGPSEGSPRQRHAPLQPASRAVAATGRPPPSPQDTEQVQRLWAPLGVHVHECELLDASAVNACKDALELFWQQHMQAVLDAELRALRLSRLAAEADCGAAEARRPEDVALRLCQLHSGACSIRPGVPAGGFGHVPGVACGDRFQLRGELAWIGVHASMNDAVHAASTTHGKRLATSILLPVASLTGGGGRAAVVAAVLDPSTRATLAANTHARVPVRVVLEWPRDDLAALEGPRGDQGAGTSGGTDGGTSTDQLGRERACTGGSDGAEPQLSRCYVYLGLYDVEQAEDQQEHVQLRRRSGQRSVHVDQFLHRAIQAHL